MPTGRIKWFDTRQGYGYIIPDEGGPDVFVHHAEVKCEPAIDEGDRVQYDVRTSPKGPIALDVRRLST